MIPVKCHTNLDDVMQCEKFPQFLPAMPARGDYIVSSTIWPGKFQLSLVVVGCEWKKTTNNGLNETWRDAWIPHIELGRPPWTPSIAEFTNWYAYHRGLKGQDEYRREVQRIIEVQLQGK